VIRRYATGWNWLFGKLFIEATSLVAASLWEHVLRDKDDYGRHVDYIHFNPVKHGARFLGQEMASFQCSALPRIRSVFPEYGGSCNTNLDGVGSE
jgi:hypothetical protein